LLQDSAQNIDQFALWMVAFQAGDIQGFQMIVERNRDAVVRYLYRCVGNHAVAEELAQDVFVRVYLSRNYQPTAKFRTWLFRIATRLAINWLRDHRPEQGSVPLDAPLCHMPRRAMRSQARSAEEELVELCRLDEVRCAIHELPERNRAAVLMHKYEEMEYAEIAKVLHCSVSATKSLIFRSYELLRVRLAHLDAHIRCEA
jgi:RNA polymerase sigma-70 factor, ECF subfamily